MNKHDRVERTKGITEMTEYNITYTATADLDGSSLEDEAGEYGNSQEEAEQNFRGWFATSHRGYTLQKVEIQALARHPKLQRTIFTQEPGKYHAQKTVGGWVVVFIQDSHNVRNVDGGKVHESRQNAYAKAKRLNDYAEAQRLLEVYREYAAKVRGPDYGEVPEGIFESIESDIKALGYEIVRKPHELPTMRKIK